MTRKQDPFDFPLHQDIAYRFDGLYQWLHRKYQLQPVEITLGKQVVRIYKVADSDRVLNEVLEGTGDAALDNPYWGELWPSAVRLAEYLCREEGTLAGNRVLELGCGLGLAGIAAHIAGAEVLLSDIAEDALRLAELNWIVNFYSAPQLRRIDWLAPDCPERFEVILAADVAYEERLFRPFIHTLDQLLAPEGCLYLSEPNRKIARTFFTLLAESGFDSERQASVGESTGGDMAPTIYRVCRKG